MKTFFLHLFLSTAMAICANAQIHFSYQQQNHCDSSTVTFTNLNPSGSYQPQLFLTTGFTYSWDFGNGQTSTNENPVGIHFGQSGVYPVNYSVVIDTAGFFLTSINVSSVICGDPFWGDPDVYITIRDGSNQIVYSTESSYFGNQAPPYNWSMNLKLTNPPYFIWVWDLDPIDPHDNCVNDSEAQPGVSTLIPLPFNTSAGFDSTFFSGSNLNLNYTFHFYKPVQTYSEQQYITVHESPQKPLLNTTGGTYSIFENIPDIVATTSPGCIVEWFDDSGLSNLIHTGTNYQFVPADTGAFYLWARQKNQISNCFSEAVQISYLIFDPTDVNELEISELINIFPNPSNDFITIEIPGYFGVVKIKLLDLTGAYVKNEVLDFENSSTFDISFLNNGIYQLIIQLDEKEIIAKKIAIIK